MEIDCDPLPPRCSVPTRRPSWRTKRRVPRQYLARSASDLAPLIGHRRLRRLRQPFASPEGEGLEPRRGQSSCQSSGIGEPLTINRQLSGWNLPPLAIRAFGAHCIIRARSFSTTTSNASAETQHLQRFPTLSNVQPSKLGQTVSSRLARTSLIRPLLRRLLRTLPPKIDALKHTNLVCSD